MVSDATLYELLKVKPKSATLFFAVHPKLLMQVLVELRNRRDWAIYEIRETEQC